MPSPTALLPLLAASWLAAADNPLDRRVTVQVQDAPVSQFLDALSQMARLNFIIKGGTDEMRMTASLQGVTVRQALEVLAETKGLRYRKLAESNTYVIESKDAPEFKDPLASCPGIPKAKVTLRLRNAPIGQFLEKVSRQAKVSFSLADGLQEHRVTAMLERVTVAEALAIVLDLKGLRCRVGENSGIFLIEPQQP